ncbi:solute carrier family 66 member 3 [Helicoverpa zea]|uniref:solute carrier family 66 member 3 n=1 Tax=Helicoverpa zea TaxID=7113 RepID=UPI001F59E272|nr:solute carrier family 66 member 3 [Helicoverpa zea]XP_047040864.1 solute carrier family 66 member 3 [Helicoverpa zea]
METTVSKNFANVLSTLTILSCLFLKVPQICYIRQKRSAEGIFVQALLMEIFGFSIMTLYNYTNDYGIMTYMEYPIILLQVYVMFYYVLKFKKMLCMSIVPITTIAYVSAVAAFAMGTLPKHILSYLVPLCTPLSGFAKVTYIYGIVCEGNADAVSLTTWVISVATNLARIFTVYVDSADMKLMTNFFISTLLSLAVLCTAVYYKRQCCPPRRQRRKSNGHCSHCD